MVVSIVKNYLMKIKNLPVNVLTVILLYFFCKNLGRFKTMAIKTSSFDDVYKLNIPQIRS